MARISEVLTSVGSQVRQLRIAADMSQADLAERANLGVATVQRLENGRDVSLSTLAAVVRVLNRLEWFETLDPLGEGPTPMELLRLREGLPARPKRVARKNRLGERQ
ncbi:helix-turn-helix domain-containing protein [Bifidobacterium aquikefiri]|uniref:helix-turn-helix domain-containing protein n=1 Tax=Bifidobacterium aquikefiri TaxID=1653207 RepID=UPI0039EB6745